MSMPTGDSQDEWLDFAFSEPSSEKRPRDDLTNKDMSWLLLVWIDASKYQSIKEELAQRLPTVTLVSKTALLMDSSKDWGYNVAELIKELQELPDKDARKVLLDRISIQLLVAAWLDAHFDLSKIRMKMWNVLLNKLTDPSFFAYPENLSADLTRLVIRKNCGGTDAEFIGKISKADLQAIFPDEKEFWLRRKNAAGGRESMCTMVRNINTLRKLGIHRKLNECEQMINDRSKGDDKLQKNLEPLREQITKARDIMTKWEEGNPEYDCTGPKCVKLHLLSSMAQTITRLDETCSARVKEEQRKRLGERERGGEKLTFKEKTQKYF